MNAIDLLKEDHDAVDALFARCESTPPSRHEATIKRIKGELETHAHLEEKIFYPACKQRGKEDLQKLVAEALEEHAQMKKFLREMTRTTSTDTREAKLKVLIEDTRHHVKEEENEMFPMVEDQFTSEELEKLGERMEAEKKKFQKAKGITPRRSQPAAKGVVATVLDKAKELVSSMAGTPGENSGSKKGRSSAKASKSSSNGRSRSSSGQSNAGNGGSSKKSGSSRSGSGSASKSTSGSGSKKGQSSTKSAGGKGSSRSKASAGR